MSEVPEKAPPSQHGDDESEEGDSQPKKDVQPTTPKPKSRRTKTDLQRTNSRPKRRTVADDAIAESSGTIRRPKSAMSSKPRPSRVPATAPQGSHHRQYAAHPDPRAYHSDFIPPRYPVPASGYGGPLPPAMSQANQARHFTQLPRFYHPNAAPLGWGPRHWNQQGWDAYGQPMPPDRPYTPALPGFPRPLKRPPPSPLERENIELKKALGEIRAEQVKQKKEMEKMEKAKVKAAKRAAEREAIRKKTIEEMGPFMEQYLRMHLRENNLATQETIWDPERIPRTWVGYDERDALPRAMRHNSPLEREYDLNPTLEEFSQFLQRKRSVEEQWPYGQSMRDESLNESSAYGAGFASKPLYKLTTDPTFQGQVEAAVADMMPRIIQQVQQGTNLDQSHQPPSRDFAAEAADFYQVYQYWNEHNFNPVPDQPAPERTPKLRKTRVDSGYASVTNVEASNSGRARKTKGRKKPSSRKLKEEADMANGQTYPDIFQAEDDDEFEMIPGRKPAPYGYSGVLAPDPPFYL